MKPLRKILTYFALGGDSLNPDECTKIIGIQPTQCYSKGDIFIENKPPRPTGSWCIETEWLEIDDTNDGIDLVMDIIWPYRDSILKIVEKSNLKACIVSAINIYAERPAYWVNKQNIYRMSYLNCDYIWDIYDLREEE